jgi:hypothetical protein
MVWLIDFCLTYYYRGGAHAYYLKTLSESHKRMSGKLLDKMEYQNLANSIKKNLLEDDCGNSRKISLLDMRITDDEQLTKSNKEYDNEIFNYIVKTVGNDSIDYSPLNVQDIIQSHTERYCIYFALINT